MAHSISFPASISGHKFAWASIFFGKKRGKPIFETTLNVDGDDVLTGSFTTSMDDEPFYIRVLYMHECSQIILEQKFQP